LSYTSDPQHLYQLPDFTAINAPGLVWSARSAWRRGLSKSSANSANSTGATPR
jgi:predicted deacetylase